MSTLYLVSFVIAVCCAVMTLGLQCFQCGQYNDGVGSITPCLNYTHMQLKDCPKLEQTYCLKYVSEGTTIRDCVQKCAEKETWGTRTYCCREDACNSSTMTTHYFWLMALCTLLLYKMSH